MTYISVNSIRSLVNRY